MDWTSLYVSFDFYELAKASQLCMYDVNKLNNLFCNLTCLWVYHCLLPDEDDKFNNYIYWIRVSYNSIRYLWVYESQLLEKAGDFIISSYWISAFITLDVCGFTGACWQKKLKKVSFLFIG